MFLLSVVATAPHEVVSGDGSVDLIIEDELHKKEPSASVTRPGTPAAVTQTPSMNLNPQNRDPSAPNVTKETKGETVKAKKSGTITTARAILPTSVTLTTTTTPSTNATSIATPLAVPKQLASVTAPTKKSKLSWDEATTQTSTQPPKKTKEQGKLESRSHFDDY